MWCLWYLDLSTFGTLESNLGFQAVGETYRLRLQPAFIFYSAAEALSFGLLSPLSPS